MAVAAGIIAIWAGTLAAIPVNWNLCDGTEGTPDLIGRFVKGVATAVNPGTTEGSNTHTHSSMTSAGAHTHTLGTLTHLHSTSSSGSHSHFYTPQYRFPASGSYQDYANSSSGSHSHNTNYDTGHAHALASSGAHTHAINTADGRPPFYEVAYIQAAEGANITTGIIIIWPDPIADIPSGWYLCNGNSSTPDLRERFLRGIDTSETDPGSTGGASTHTHTLQNCQAHSHTCSETGNHTHTYSSYTWSHDHTTGYAAQFTSGPGTDVPSQNDSGGGNHQHSATNNTGAHTHTIGDGGVHDHGMVYPGIEETDTGSDAYGTNHTVNIPVAGVQANDYIVLFFSTDGGVTVGAPGGWTILAQASNGSANTFAIIYKLADGNEGTTITVTTSASEATAHLSYRIRGAVDITISNSATGSSTTPNPGTLAHGWGSLPVLWLASCGWDANKTCTGYPAGYSGGMYARYNSTSGCGVATAYKSATAETEDAGTFTISATDTWVAYTVALKPKDFTNIDSSSSLPSYTDVVYIYCNGATDIPISGVVIWAGLLANVPTGYGLCDGSNGKPDYGEKFIRGAANGVDPGGTGGSNTHTHTENNPAGDHRDHSQSTAGAHTHNSTNVTGAHLHSFSYPTVQYDGYVSSIAHESDSYEGSHSHSVYSAGGHNNHVVSAVSTTHNHQPWSTDEATPAFYEVAFIIYEGEEKPKPISSCQASKLMAAGII